MKPQGSAGSSSTRDLDQAALIASIAAGDQHALSALYDTTNGLLYGLVLRILGDTGTAEEVLLDVYTQVWRQAARYSDGRGTPLAWLTTIARTRAIDRLRSGRQEQQCCEPLETASQNATDDNFEDLAVTQETQRKVRAALDALSTEQREVIELAYYSGMSHSEIASKLGQPLGTVKTRMRLGMMKLRGLLKTTWGEI